MLSVRFYREIKSTAEQELSAALQQLVASNPMVQQALALSYQVRPLCTPRWLVEYRRGILWLYRASDQLKNRTPIGAVYLATDPAPDPKG